MSSGQGIHLEQVTPRHTKRSQASLFSIICKFNNNYARCCVPHENCFLSIDKKLDCHKFK